MMTDDTPRDGDAERTARGRRMICDMCGGDGVLPIIEIDEKTGRVLCGELPCPECGGSGRSHCCEG